MPRSQGGRFSFPPREGQPSRRLACAGVLAALGALARWSTATARRGGERPRRHAEPQNGIPLANALAPENLRRGVSSQRGVRAWTDVTTHSRTTGYRSSAGELVWLDGRRRGKICATAKMPEVEVAALHWTSYSQRAWRPGGAPAPKPTPEERQALSYFHVGPRHRPGHRSHGQNHTAVHYVEPIEPLHGVARHPFAQVGCNHSVTYPRHVSLFDITYLVIHNQCGRPGPKPRSLLFDMGASVGFKGVPGGVYATLPIDGGGLAPSLPLFYRIYADRCLEPDEVYAWEPNPQVRGADWWGELPARIRAKVRFYNDVVDEGELAQAEAPGPHPAQSFLEILGASANPDDFVAVKVDIDTPFAELTIMEAIADRPEIAALIDEIFFEYHFWFDGLEFGWLGNVQGDVDTAVGLMRRLRALGVRAHFWI